MLTLVELVTQMTDRIEEVKTELECPVCLEDMAPPRQIWMCSGSGHPVCGECRGRLEAGCPSCKTPVDKRCTVLEKMAAKLFA